MTETTIEIETDEEIALEIAYGIMGRALDIHDNPDNEFEDVAEELREIGQTLRDQYE